MICFTQNNPIKTNARAYRIGEQFNLPKYKEFPFVHAESHLISKLLDTYNTIDTNWSIVVLRINRRGLVLGSKPCENCDKILNAVGLTNIYYSNDDASFSDSLGDLIEAESLTLPILMV
jgi:deoxycytidylate deaminase